MKKILLAIALIITIGSTANAQTDAFFNWNLANDDIYRSICAYANDFDNLGGGYIVVGVEEKDGVAVRPVHGIPQNMVDKIQKEMLNYNHKIQPLYFAKPIPEVVDGNNIMVIWVPTGVMRPYKTVEHVTSDKDKNYKYMIRYGYIQNYKIHI